MKRTVSGAPDVQSPMEPGQIEQVVSSADCREVDPLASQDASVSSNQAIIRGGETAGTSSPDANQLTHPAPNAGEAIPVEQDPHPALPDANDQPILTLEDRLLVALAGRGAQRIGQFIELAIMALAYKGPFTYVGSDWPAVPPLFWLSDEALVEAVEGQVRGDDEGLPAAERQGVSGVDAVLHREPDVRS